MGLRWRFSGVFGEDRLEIYGSLASAIGAPRAVTVGGCIVIIGALVFSRELPKLREIVRPIYIKHGIIKELNAGIYAASGPVEIIEKK